MRPKTLKEPTKCCGSPTLLWSKAKQEFNCPCGQVRTDLDGRVLQIRQGSKGRQIARGGFTYGFSNAYGAGPKKKAS